MSTNPKSAKARAQKISRLSHDRLVVAVLKLLPQRVRERFCYVLLAAVLTLAIMGMFHAPVATAVGTTGLSVLSMLTRVLGR